MFLYMQKRNKSKFEAIMVDPLEAKRLAKIQMQEIKAKERLKVWHFSSFLTNMLIMFKLLFLPDFFFVFSLEGGNLSSYEL